MPGRADPTSRPDPRKLSIKLLVEADGAAGAEAELRAIVPLLAPHAAVTKSVLKPYAKVAGTWMLTLDLDPVGPPLDAFDRLVGLAGAGWSGDTAGEGDPWAVWNPEPGHALLTPRVRWATLETWVP
jgi:hypothetical protein